jgi:CheY-like chemotaxis protein/two-component sensor histidine kinase
LITPEPLGPSPSLAARSEWLESLRRLSGGIAHHLRNALTVILGRLQLLSAAPLPPDVRASLEVIADQSRRMDRLVTSLSRFAKRVEPNRGRHSLNDVIEETAGLVRAELELRGIEPTLALDPAAPIVSADRQQLEEVLMNLFMNAIEAMPHGGRLSVTTAQAADGSAVAITIADTGIGIPADALSKVFDPFFSTKPGATGLGLTVVQSTVEGHGGKMEISSRVGAGTTVLITWPVATVETAIAEELPTAPILVVDDEPEVAIVIAEFLKAKGYNVAIAGSGADALLSAAADPPRLVLLDVQMPGMNGLEVLRALHSRGVRTPVIMVTAVDDLETGRRALAEGAADFVQKPIDFDYLERSVLGHIGPPPD